MKPITQDIVLTNFDHHRLRGLLSVCRERAAISPFCLHALELELSRARTVTAEAVPPDVVTMNSKLVLRNLDTGERTFITLAFPDALPHDRRRVSVLSPLGLAILGSRVGDIVHHAKPGGTHRLLIERIDYQPEAHGNYFM